MTQALVVNETQAAEMLGRSVQTLRNWRQQRRGLPYVKQGRSVSYLREDIENFLRANRIDPEADTRPGCRVGVLTR